MIQHLTHILEGEKSLGVGGMEQKPAGVEQRLTVAKATNHKASPIPQRAKFLRKFNKGGKKKALAPTRKKEDRGTEEKKVREEGREDVTAAGREGAVSMETQQPIKEVKASGAMDKQQLVIRVSPPSWRPCRLGATLAAGMVVSVEGIAPHPTTWSLRSWCREHSRTAWQLQEVTVCHFMIYVEWLRRMIGI